MDAAAIERAAQKIQHIAEEPLKSVPGKSPSGWYRGARIKNVDLKKT